MSRAPEGGAEWKLNVVGVMLGSVPKALPGMLFHRIFLWLAPASEKPFPLTQCKGTAQSPANTPPLLFFFLFMEWSVIADTLFLFIVCIPTLNYSFMRVGTRSVMFIAVFPAPRTSDNVCGMNVSMDFIL